MHTVLPGAEVIGVAFTPDRDRSGAAPPGAARLACPCGGSTAAVDDQSTRRWRRLELGALELVLQAEMRRLNSKIRLINHGGYGRHSAIAVIADLPVLLRSDRHPASGRAWRGSWRCSASRWSRRSSR